MWVKWKKSFKVREKSSKATLSKAPIKKKTKRNNHDGKPNCLNPHPHPHLFLLLLFLSRNDVKRKERSKRASWKGTSDGVTGQSEARDITRRAVWPIKWVNTSVFVSLCSLLVTAHLDKSCPVFDLGLVLWRRFPSQPSANWFIKWIQRRQRRRCVLETGLRCQSIHVALSLSGIETEEKVKIKRRKKTKNP